MVLILRFYETFCNEAKIDMEEFGELTNIQTEVTHTHNNKSGRIDIIMETESGIIVVKQKNAKLDNPFDVSKNYAEKSSKSNKEYVLLNKK